MNRYPLIGRDLPKAIRRNPFLHIVARQTADARQREAKYLTEQSS